MQSASNNSILKLTFIGGCHIIGFLVGKENSFVSVCSRKLQIAKIQNMCNIYPYINLKRSKDAIKISEISQPDILIVQCHYLFNPDVVKKIRSSFRGKKNAPSKDYKRNIAHSDFKSRDVDATFTPTIRYWTQQYLMRLFHLLTFNMFLNMSNNRIYIDIFFTALKQAGIKNVIVLGPFPCTNIVLNKFRQKGNELLYKKSLKFGYQYIDVFPIIQKQFAGKIFTIDDVHLNKEAHKFLGEYLSQYLVNFKIRRNNFFVKQNNTVENYA